MLLFCPKMDVPRDFVIKYAPELLMGNNVPSLHLRSFWPGCKGGVQEAACWDKESAIFARLICEDLLAHGTRIQATFAPQAI